MEREELKNVVIADLQEKKEYHEKMISKLQSANTAYHATGSVIGALIYMKVQVRINDDEYPQYSNMTFDGDAYGIAALGGGALVGDIYTDDILRLFSSTCYFEINVLPVYVNINFFDSSHQYLGSYHAGAVAVTGGMASGKGSWHGSYK
ncbi:VapA/VapB family virulence-associated protein [Butyrivibrio sp. INlla21]|uniref:VapA/VapB family virulence-associated protein n=1 Tax=Butyrivibrio sp. INlla21 TaxID=1520811 RepID=UPI0008E078E8|nr:VapA/VapB family virulence-associated protein [Butyrivibrio sp. INlla21]SFU78849.1 virulence-associated protein [Butyrivibrio sp. INlla21]